MITTLERQKTTLEQLNLKILGRLFWASIPSKATWSRKEFEEAMLAAGVPIEVSPALSNRSDFIRALRSMEQDRLIRLVREDKEEIIFQATRELEDGIGLSYEREAVITFDKTDGTIEATDASFAKAIRDRIGDESDLYRSEDLRRVSRRILNQYAKSISPRSAVYFVPEQQAQWIEIIADFLVRLNVGKIGEFPLADLGSIREQMSKTYSTQARQTIQELSLEIHELKDNGASPTVLNRRFKNIKELRAKADLYRNALDIEVEEISKALNSVEENLREALLS